MWIRVSDGDYINVDTGARVVWGSSGSVELSWTDQKWVLGFSEENMANLIHYLMTEAIDCRKPKEVS